MIVKYYSPDMRRRKRLQGSPVSYPLQNANDVILLAWYQFRFKLIHVQAMRWRPVEMLSLGYVPPPFLLCLLLSYRRLEYDIHAQAIASV